MMILRYELLPVLIVAGIMWPALASTTVPPAATALLITTTAITTTPQSEELTPVRTTERLEVTPTPGESVTTESGTIIPLPSKPASPDTIITGGFPNHFQFFGNDGLEETFTYQVKQQRRPSSSKLPDEYNDELNFLKNRIRNDQSYDEIRNYVNELHYQMNLKIRNITETFESINKGVKGDISGLGSAIHQLTSDVHNLTTLSKETTRSVKALQYAQELERTSFHSQVSNLTGQIEKIQTERTNDLKLISDKLSTIQAKVDNSSQDLKVHEAYIRYGQQLMQSMKVSLEKTDQKVSGLEKDGGPQWAEQTVGCGGVITANSGIISYKFRQPYMDDERCVWIIRANRRSKINLQLIEDGFQNQSNSDFLTVTEFAAEEHNRVNLVTSSRLEHGNKVLHTFQGPVIFLTFYSDASIPGTGFSIKFEGIGNRSDAASPNAERYKHLHFGGTLGTFVYPQEEGLEYQPNELVTVAINPIIKRGPVKVHMIKSDLEKDQYCEFDSVNFYGSVTGSYALTKRYCQQNEEFNGEIIQSSDGIFLMIFRSDTSTQLSGFKFMWEA